MDDLLAEHRKEKRELQAKVTQKRKSATKKTRKGVNDECETLEAEMLERHAQEIATLDGATNAGQNSTDKVTAVGSDSQQVVPDTATHKYEQTIEDKLSTEISELDLSTSSTLEPLKKPNRQKARLARRAAEQARLVQEAEAEASDMPDLRSHEKHTMEETFQSHGLEEKEIRADGHCLYAAIADQIRAKGGNLKVGNVVTENDDFRTVRHVAANYITAHGDDFVPFLEEDLDTYVRKVRDTGEWGGQIELQALAKAYNLKICIVQGNGSVTEIGDGKDARIVWLAYYRHGFGLGEHYNSLRHNQSTTST
jgi:OTU domain-containing protein 6